MIYKFAILEEEGIRESSSLNATLFSLPHFGPLKSWEDFNYTQIIGDTLLIQYQCDTCFELYDLRNHNVITPYVAPKVVVPGLIYQDEWCKLFFKRDSFSTTDPETYEEKKFIWSEYRLVNRKAGGRKLWNIGEAYFNPNTGLYFDLNNFSIEILDVRQNFKVIRSIKGTLVKNIPEDAHLIY